MKSEFEGWFVAHHGEREHYPYHAATDEVLRQAIVEGNIANRELDRRVVWDQKYQSALYAWSASKESTR